MAEFVTVARVDEVPEGAGRQFVVGERQIGVFNCAGSWYAIDNVCTHAYAELHEGEVDPDDCTVECPLHGSRFDLASGRALNLPAITPVAVYEVRIAGDEIQVAL
ncbi:MAG TPA: non-heme iron oxygenase ferredoxin subunit [Herpetosiphonaceae bacterium]